MSMSKLSLVDELSSPPMSGSRRSRDKSGDVSRGQRNSSRGLPLGDMSMSKLSLVDELSSPPLSSSRRSRDKSGDVSRSERNSSWCFSLSPLSNGHMMHITVGEVGAGNSLSESSMVDITEGIVGTGELS